MHTHAHTRTHTCTHTHTHMHTHTHTHTHLFIHTHNRYVVIWKKVQSTWYLYTDIFNSNTPPSQ